jgi:hypothetical protein
MKTAKPFFVNSKGKGHKNNTKEDNTERHSRKVRIGVKGR